MAHPPALHRFWRWLRGGPALAPAATAAAAPQALHTGLRQQRGARREMLFSLVRENMIRLGVLSSHYKFKVLTLDPAGDQFIVMVDWQPGASGASPRFERSYEQALQSLLAERRQAYKVKAVYWRGAPATVAEPTPAPSASAAPSVPAAPAARPAQRPAPAAPLPLEQVSDEELKALQAALRQAGTARRLPADTPDFEPTLNTAGQAGTEFGSLSETQYGKL